MMHIEEFPLRIEARGILKRLRCRIIMKIFVLMGKIFKVDIGVPYRLDEKISVVSDLKEAIDIGIDFLKYVQRSADNGNHFVSDTERRAIYFLIKDAIHSAIEINQIHQETGYEMIEKLKKYRNSISIKFPPPVL